MRLTSGIYMRCTELNRLSEALWRRRHWGYFGVAFLIPLLSGCAEHAQPLSNWIGEGKLSDVSGWRSEAVTVDNWQLEVVRRGSAAARRIYIEGDGHAYISRDTPSADPTPVEPIGLQLAMADGSEGVMYVARPCQWVQGPECNDKTLWTEKRFTKEVVDKYVSLVRTESAGQPVELVGFSGGAWIALQVAAQLNNVVKVRTVAGNLMPEWVNAQHKVTAIEVEAYPNGRLSEVPVVAYLGGEDKVVGRGVVDAYISKVKPVRIVRVTLEGVTHQDGWVKAWPSALKMTENK